MNGKPRVQQKMVATNGKNDSRATVIMLRDKTMDRELSARTKPGERIRKSAYAESLLAREQAHREELERIHLQYAERIRQLEAARLEAERRLEQQQNFHTNLAEEAKHRTAELLSAKDLLLKSTEGAATVEKRLVDLELQRDAMETDRRMLHETLQSANQKYQGLTEQLTVLKQRVTQEETARRAAEQALAQATAQLEETQTFLQEERTALQLQLTQRSQQEHAFRAAAEEAAKNLLRLEADLETRRSQLEAANQKYRSAGEQVAALKQRVTEEQTARQTTEQALAQATTQLEQAQSYLQEERASLLQQVVQLSQQEHAFRAAAEEAAKNLLRLEGELETRRSQLEAANQKYRGAGEQLTALKQQLAQVTAEGQAKVDGAEKTRLRLEAELEAGRNKLGEANEKYRGASEQIAALKQRVTQEEMARHAAEQAVAQATVLQEETQNYLQEERAALRQQLAQVTAEGQAKVDGAEKTRLRLEAELETRRSQLEAANQKYRGAGEQLSELKQRMTQEEGARREVEQALAKAMTQVEQAQGNFQKERTALKQQLAQVTAEGQAKVDGAEKTRLRLEAELETRRSQLEEANQKYRGAGEQLSELKQRMTQEEGTRREAEQALAKAMTQLEEAQNNLQKECAALQQRVEEEEKARQMAEQALTQATTQLGETQCCLLEERAALLRHQLTQLAVEEQAKKIAVHEAEGGLLRLEAELEAANQQYRSADQQVTMLQQRVKEEETARQMAEQVLAQVTVQLQQTQSSFQDERATLQQQLFQVTAEEQAKRIALHEAEGRLLCLEAELETAGQQYRNANEQVAALQQRVKEEGTAREEAEMAVTKTTTWLEQTKSRNRQLTTEEIPKLKNKLETQFSLVRDGRHALEQLRLELRENKKMLAETTRQLEKARQQISAAGHQLEKTHSTTISYRLGYLLIHNFKSVNGLRRLPSALWALRKETVKRRKKKVFIPSPPKLTSLSKPSFVESQPLGLTEFLPQERPSNGPVTSADAALLVTTQPTTPSAPARKLTIACIMDDFAFNFFQPEATLHQLTPGNWRAELDGAKPDLLFIEFAGLRKDTIWCHVKGQTSAELQGIVEWCRVNKVPTVFWGREDPTHFETGLKTAKLFEYVFTTDIDSIHLYKGALGHDRVYLLPFACQPATNNPVEICQRKDAIVFAGAYDMRYPERICELDGFVLELPAFRPLEIYDHNYGKNDPNCQFPVEYRQYIVGALPFGQIDKVYKGYRYAINLNSIKQSQSMFSHSVLEFLASNTLTISNFSRGLRLLFGDLVIATDSGAEAVRRLKRLGDNEACNRKLRLASLRKVMQEHTYAQRLAYVVSKVRGKAVAQSLPHISVLAYAGSRGEIESIQTNYRRQLYANTSLYVVVGEEVNPLASEDHRVHFLTRQQANDLLVEGLGSNAELISGMVAEDYYGPNYLKDIVLATRYTQADLIGKAARYICSSGRFHVGHQDDAYHPVQRLPARAAAIRRQVIAKENVLEWVQSLSSRQLEVDQGLAIDEFNYCEQGAAADPILISETVDDLPGLNTGIAIDDLLRRAERIAPGSNTLDDAPIWTGAQLAGNFGKKPGAAITLAVEGQSWRVASTLPDGKHDYFYATADHSLAELGVTEQLKIYFDVTSGLDIQLIIVSLDVQRQKISQIIKPANCNVETVIPPGTDRIRFGLRIYASGQADIQSLVLGHRNLQPAELIGEAERLLLTNQYPSYNDLYRNAFVHSRVAAYAERGMRVDVFRLQNGEGLSFHEFHNEDIITGSQEALHILLTGGRYKSVLVHFLDEAMWQVLQHHIGQVKVFVWAHGFEIQPWHRRDNFENEQQRDKAKIQSKARMAFWQSLLRRMPDNLTLIFVSRYLAEVTMEDLGFRLPESRYAIIPNAIDTELFAYHKKSAEQRRKVLSIRPYASRTYANDLSVKAILLLSQKPYFKDLEFRIIGDGRLFDEVLAPVRGFDNVHIERRFLTHREIAVIHREYGIFLCPSRMDTQGVSRDEAMSSGLVPVTNAVAAIPEFVDGTCGFLASPEDSAGLAEGIAKLYESPELFLAMSVAAAERVRLERGRASTIGSELALLGKVGI